MFLSILSELRSECLPACKSDPIFFPHTPPFPPFPAFPRLTCAYSRLTLPTEVCGAVTQKIVQFFSCTLYIRIWTSFVISYYSYSARKLANGFQQSCPRSLICIDYRSFNTNSQSKVCIVLILNSCRLETHSSNPCRNLKK